MSWGNVRLKNILNMSYTRQKDLPESFGDASLPSAFEREYRNANREWGWQHVFQLSDHK